MEFENYKEMSNTEIKVYQETLKNEYEAIKHQISLLCNKLDEMDVEWNKVEAELSRRQSKRW